MIHGIQQLVLEREGADDEVEQTEAEDQNSVGGKDAVDDAEDEDEDGLREEESVLELGRLDELSIVFAWVDVSLRNL